MDSRKALRHLVKIRNAIRSDRLVLGDNESPFITRGRNNFKIAFRINHTLGLRERDGKIFLIEGSCDGVFVPEKFRKKARKLYENVMGNS